MAFQIKKFTDVVAGMVNHFRGTTQDVTDFNIGSVARTMLEAPAIEIDELYQQMFNGLREAIPVATYTSFNFERLAAAPATGVVRVTITAQAAAVLIPAGTVFETDEARTSYLSLVDVTIAPAGTTGDVTVAASVAGVVGNLPQSAVLRPSPLPVGFVSATNLKALTNGRSLETPDERKQRFVSYIETLQRGTTAAVLYGARTVALFNAAGVETERVRAVSLIEPYVDDPGEPISLVEVYIHNGVGTTSGGLVTETAKVLHGYTDPLTGVKVAGWKAAGVKVVVAAAIETLLAITAEITPMPGYDGAELAALSEDVLTKYILDLDIGESFVNAHAVVLVSSVPGVANITGLPADTPVDQKHKLMPGAIAVTPA